MPDRVYNFSPGPAVLPLAVLQEAQRDLVALPGAGMSVLEMSHRSKSFAAILAETKALLAELLAIPAGYTIVFAQGGASLQFSMVPMNFLRGTGKTAHYVLTGTWGNKALAEARREGPVHVAWDGKEHGYSRLPSPGEIRVDPQAAYVHITSNETIQGVQFPSAPDLGAAPPGNVPLVCDASSDFLSRPIRVDRYGLIYACAQKNAGIAGLTVAIVRDDLLGRVPDGLPSMLDYKLLAKNDSLYNTPPTFAIYVFMLVLRWLKGDVGGLTKMAERDRRKASLLYDVIDRSEGFYRGHARADSRSQMNVTWRLPSEELERAFVQQARSVGLVELQGHRSVGGIRASIYNAMPAEGVQALADFMVDFRRKNG